MMKTYKVIIVDDEEMSADGTRLLLESFRKDLEVIGVFYSSQGALNFLSDHQTDLIITDINMPEISGLELIAALKEVDYQAEVIIITGFGTLAYAQEAMRYGVKQFLQKPFAPQEIFDSIDAALVDRRRHSELEVLKRKEAIADVILGEETFTKSESPLFSILMYMDRHSDDYQPIIEGWLKSQKIDYFSDTIRDTVLYCLFEGIGKEGVVTLPPAFKELSLFYETAQNQSIIKDTFLLGQELLQLEFYYDHGKLWRKEDQMCTTFSTRLPYLFNDFSKLLESNEFSQAGLLLDEIFEEVVLQQFPVNLLKKAFIEQSSQWIQEYKLEVDLTVWIDLIQQTPDFSNFKNEIRALLNQIKLREDAQLMGNNIAANLNLIIEKYFENSQLTLRWISQNLLFLNPDYLGKIYLKETGQRFTARLLEVRMQKAAEYLAEGYKVYEVAKKVGYENNPVYFGQLFRKTYQMTPKQYSARSRRGD